MANDPVVPADKAITDAQAFADNTTSNFNVLHLLLGETNKMLKEVGESFIKSFGSDTAVKAIKDAISRIGDMGSVIRNSMDSIKVLGNDFENVGVVGVGAIDGVTDSVDRLLVDLDKASAFIGWGKMFEGMDVGGASINTVSGNIESLTEILANFLHIDTKTIVGKFGKVSDAFINNAQQAEKLDNTYISLQASAGNMNDLFDESGKTLIDLSAKTKNYTNQILDVAGATGQNKQNTMAMANELSKLPKYLDQTVSSGGNASDQLKTLHSTMQLMSGTGQSSTTIIKILGESYDKLGQATGRVTDQAQKGAEFLADISSVANTLGINFQQLQPHMENIAEKFKFIGNESDDGAKFLTRYTDALRQTGLTAQSSMEIVDQMAGSMSKMTMGTKAFLSLRSGGPGGLQGAFKIEELLAHGKLDQVVQMAEKAMRQQFNGRIVTREEAATQGGATASQFMRQRSLLQSGAFGIGKDVSDDQATKLLEAMGKKDFGTISKTLKVGQEAIGDVFSKGKAIDERNNTELKKIALQTERMAVAGIITAGIMMKREFGTTGNNRNDLLDSMKRSGISGDESVKRSATARTAEDYKKEEAISERQYAVNMLESTNGIIDGLVQAGKDVAKDAGNVANDFKGLLGQVPMSAEEKVMDNTIAQPRQSMSKSDRSLQNVLKISGETTISAKYNPQSQRMPTIAEANVNPEMMAQRKKMMQESSDRRQGIYTNAVHSASSPQHRTSAVITTNREALKTQAEVKQLPPQKIALEITAPPGFGVNVKSAPASVSVNNFNGAASGANNGRSDPGY